MQTLLHTTKPKKIGLTALIDVVFILLMFFMLTSSFSQWNTVSINVPSSGQSITVNKPQFILLHADNSMKIHGSDLSLLSFKKFNASHLSKIDSSQTITLIPEGEVDLQKIIDAIEHFKSKGIENISLGESLS